MYRQLLVIFAGNKAGGKIWGAKRSDWRSLQKKQRFRGRQLSKNYGEILQLFVHEIVRGDLLLAAYNVAKKLYNLTKV